MENIHPVEKPRLEGEHLDFDKNIQPGDVIDGPNNTKLRFERRWPDGPEFTTLDGKFIVSVNSKGFVRSVEELD